MARLARHKLNKILSQPEAELDLHGLTIREAEAELNSFLLKAERLSWQKVKIITGQGWNSLNNKAVLSNFVIAKLEEYGYRYERAKASEGGAGALLVKFY